MTARAEEILNSGNDKSLLELFRDETTLIVLMVRVRNQERREAWEERQKEESADWGEFFESLEREIEQ